MANACSLDPIFGDAGAARDGHADPASVAVSARRPAPRRRERRFGTSGRITHASSFRPGSVVAAFGRDGPGAGGDTDVGTHRERLRRTKCARRAPLGTRSTRRARLLLGIAAALIVVALALPWGGAGGRPLATPGPARVGDPVVAHGVYVVQPGDTLWSIAQRLVPSGDPRPIEAQLEAQVGGDKIVPGERLVLP